MFAQIRKFLSSLTGDRAEEAARRMATPAGMSRRGFLRAVGVTTAAVLVGVAPRRTIFDELAVGFDPADPFSDSITVYTRMLMREDGFMRRILPPVPITNDELDRSVPTPPFAFGPDGLIVKTARQSGKTEVWTRQVRSLARDGLPKPVSMEGCRGRLATGS